MTTDTNPKPMLTLEFFTTASLAVLIAMCIFALICGVIVMAFRPITSPFVYLFALVGASSAIAGLIQEYYGYKDWSNAFLLIGSISVLLMLAAVAVLIL